MRSTEVAGTTGLRERKKLKTRQALQRAAVDLFERDGFETTTVNDIAGACEVSPSTFFRYFPTKEAPLFHGADERTAALLVALRTRPEDESPLRAIHASVLMTVSHYQDRAGLLRQWKIIAASPALRAVNVQLRQGWEAGLLDVLAARADQSGHWLSWFQLRLVASTAVAALRVAIQTWLDEDGDLVTRIDEAFEALSTGLDFEHDARVAAP